MSSVDEKAKETAVDDSGEAPGVSSEGRNQVGGMIVLFFIVGLAASLILGWVIFPQLLYSHKKQPIDFNHALHLAEVDDDCQSCHSFREDGTFSGIPKLADCMECHEELLGETQEEEAFYRDYVSVGREVSWLVYSQQPDCVFFSHAAHVVAGKMDCVTCHGDHGHTTTLRVYQENRINGYSRDIWGKSIAGLTRNPQNRMKMDVCAACHLRDNVRQASVQTEKGGCFVCHK